MGYLSTIYLDDVCCIAPTYEECINNITQTRILFESLGFIINEEKSCLIPSNKCTYLGFIIDTKKFHISVTDSKKDCIFEEVVRLSRLKRCSIRQFARVIGLLTSACPGVKYGWLYTKQLERCKYLALLQSGSYDNYMNIPTYLQEDFSWWMNSIKCAINPIRVDNYTLEIFSDASKTGWGIACGERTASGQWSAEESSKHINFLELLAAFFGLKIFVFKMNNCQILLRIDNTTAISYINRMGGIRFPHLNILTKDIWRFCEKRNIYIYASYIRSQDNQIADAESRRLHPDTEWELSDSAFKRIVSTFGNPEIDLFATRLNSKCHNYISWHRDPGACAVNAFTLNWNNLKFYAFPPFSVIAKTLRKVITDQAQGIIVAPYWCTQAWFPLFNKLLISDPIIFEPTETPLISVSNSTATLPQFKLMAGKLSGKLMPEEVYHQIH
ncbi:jg25269 [Pararge aegeria aegeria]|uniref:Jg25269 protein n=1 Tax=Pararge aegeria aegeria TaxID=348720 RepID=A0A8S4QQZ4_9NEOP|nr:jg25269 [Pararge aegeria aegeria]